MPKDAHDNPSPDAVAKSHRIYTLIFNGLTDAMSAYIPLSERSRISAVIYEKLRTGGVEIRVNERSDQ